MPANREVFKIRSGIFVMSALHGIAFCIMMVIPEAEMIGAHSATKSEGVILIVGDRFLKSYIVSRREYFILQIDMISINNKDGILHIKDLRIKFKLLYSI